MKYLRAWFAPGLSGWGFQKPVLFEGPEFVASVGRAGIPACSQQRSWKKLISDIEEAMNEGCWVIGYFGYECMRHTLGVVPRRRKEQRFLPEAAFMFFNSEPKPCSLADCPPTDVIEAPKPNMNRVDFLRMVEKAKHYIAAGDIYQVNLSQRFDAYVDGDASHLFRKLYKVQPTPFACFLDFSDFQLLSGSMELFLQRRGTSLVTRPIKGTRPRGATRLDDLRLRRELWESEKDRAENVMIVDLMRNDLGRVCEYGSICVSKLFEVEAYRTLYQMVSEIEGTIREEKSLADILKATFPPGSVTGAPKRRAVEIIDELEPHFRGPYCGAIALFRPGGDFNLSVAIRVVGVCDGLARFWVGGGITWGSDPEEEYQETLVKAKAIMRAMGVS